MTFDPTKPVQTRDGRKARILCSDMNHPTYPIAAVITEHDGAETATTYTRGGRFIKEGESELDLINIEPSKWMNVYDQLGQESWWFENREAADSDAGRRKRIAILELRPDGEIVVHKV